MGNFKKVGIFILIKSFIVIILALECRASSNLESGFTDETLMTLVQKQTFGFFWSGAEPVSGMAPERIHFDSEYDPNIVTTGGSGFGIMAILVGIERGFISRKEGLVRLEKITA